MGWDEVLQPDTPKDVVIQSWRGPKALAAAARQGNRVLLSNGYYIDLNQPAAEHYLVDPLGGDGANLTRGTEDARAGRRSDDVERVRDAGNIDSRIWPRTAAIAERLLVCAGCARCGFDVCADGGCLDKLEFYGLKHSHSRGPCCSA